MKQSDLEVAVQLSGRRQQLIGEISSLATEDWRLCLGAIDSYDKKTSYRPVIRANDAILAEARKVLESELDDVEKKLAALDVEVEPREPEFIG